VIVRGRVIVRVTARARVIEGKRVMAASAAPLGIVMARVME